ncbi:MAG: hypothetical protein RR858_07155, partial [Mucinivorans sp.]
TRAIDFGQLYNGNTHFTSSVDLYNIVIYGNQKAPRDQSKNAMRPPRVRVRTALQPTLALEEY